MSDNKQTKIEDPSFGKIGSDPSVKPASKAVKNTVWGDDSDVDESDDDGEFGLDTYNKNSS